MPYLTTYGQMSNGEHHFIPDGVFSQPGALGNTPLFSANTDLTSFLEMQTFPPGAPVVLRDSLHRAQHTAAVTDIPRAHWAGPLLMDRPDLAVTRNLVKFQGSVVSIREWPGSSSAPTCRRYKNGWISFRWDGRYE